MLKALTSARVLLLVTVALLVYLSESMNQASAHSCTWADCASICSEGPPEETCSPSCCNPPYDCSCCDGVDCPCF